MKHLVVGNPMFAELQRQKRVALSKQNWSGGPLGARVLLISVYAYLFFLTVTNPRSVEPVALLYVLMVILFLCMPATLHGAIAGDRERRSLDLLLVAPVTPGQIIVGKFARGLALMLAIMVSIGLPCFIVQAVHGAQGMSFYWSDSYGMAGFLRGMLLVFATGAFLGALSLWISTRARSNGAALLGVVGAIFLIYVLSFVFASVIGVMSETGSQMLIDVHPFVALANTTIRNAGWASHDTVAWAWFSTICHLGLAAVLLASARNNLERISKGRM